MGIYLSQDLYNLQNARTLLLYDMRIININIISRIKEKKLYDRN